MKRRNIYCLLVGLLLIVTFTSCGKKTEYTHAIPSDATTVASIDLKSVAEKCGINDEENSTLKQHLLDALKNGLNEETSNQISKILDKPSKSGIDFKQPVYYYLSKNFSWKTVIDLSVCDKGDLNKTIKSLAKSQLCTEPEETDNFIYSVVNNKYVIAYNKGTALLVESPQGATDQLLECIDKVMTEKKENSFCSSKSFSQLTDRKGDVKFYENLEASSFGGDMTFQDGNVLLQIEKIGGKNVQPTANNTFQPITNALLNRFPKSLPFILSMGLNGTQSYNDLAAAIGLDSFNSPVVQKLMCALQGDFTLGFNTWDGKNFSFLAYAQTRDAAAIRSLCTLKDELGGTFKKLGTTDFEYHLMNTHIWYGLDGDLLYLTNNGKLVHYNSNKSGSNDSYMQNPYAAQAKGKRLFFIGDPASLSKVILQQRRFNIQPLAQNIECVRGYDVSPTSWKVEMIMKDKRTNALKQLVKIARQIVGM